MQSTENLIHSPNGRGRDRLAAFFEAFAVSTSLIEADATKGRAILSVVGRGSEITQIVLNTRQPDAVSPSVLLSVAIDFGGTANPLFSAMPARFAVDLDDQPILKTIAVAFVAEATGQRCGRQVAVDRLCEVVLLLVLRQAIERGDSRPGLLAGLSHPGLQRALIAMHDQPSHPWRMEELADICGMSRSAFMAAFPKVVGVTPAAYLQSWRIAVGQRALLRGESVKSVARRSGFASPEAFSRAYSRRFGHAPRNATGHLNIGREAQL
ncbi:AraC family transcriptional regulator [Bosea sp. LjRoot9]|uniref:helix-turn-helix transcriptional regulator n=1 Tax=Bosea sp. LjRoot9 TaxID=3342341 RepID=UPI003ECF32CD